MNILYQSENFMLSNIFYIKYDPPPASLLYFPQFFKNLRKVNIQPNQKEFVLKRH